MSDFKTTCRGANCKKTVLMRQPDPTRRPHPFDFPAQKCKRCKGKGKIDAPPQGALFGAQPAGMIDCPKCKGSGVRWVSHFDTCVDADKFRTKRE